MKKTKIELYEENIKLRRYLNFWIGATEEDLDLEEVEVQFNKQKNKLKTIKKIIISITIIFLCLSCYLVGLMW